MKREIRISRIWSDADVVELKVEVSDGMSRFANQVYVGHADLSAAVSRLDTFRDHVHGGLLDVRFGEFGCEYANGAFHARFHFPSPGRLHVTCKQESAFREFGKKTVASSATLFLNSEPALLDRFIGELRSLASGASEYAQLEAT
jgi:hypothetical protein